MPAGYNDETLGSKESAWVATSDENFKTKIY